MPLSFLLHSSGVLSPRAKTASSVREGVFTQAQAERGKGIVLDWCARCHSAELLGGETGPPLVGAEFLDKWKDQTLADLLANMQTKMPTDDPGKLSKSEYLAVLAYILHENKFPPGATPLPGDVNALSQIKITP